MNPGLLDRHNENGGLTALAQCGGLASVSQFPKFIGLGTRAARRAARDLEAARMLVTIRPQKYAAFVLLKNRTAQALGADLPTPPQQRALTFQTYQTCLARAAYFLKTSALVHTTGDFSYGRRRGERTMMRIKVLVTTQQDLLNQRAMQVAQSLKTAPTTKLRDDAHRLRRLIRPIDTTLAAGKAAFKHHRGLYLVEPSGPQARFFFVDRATPVLAYERLLETLQRFSAATMLRTHLDVGCSSELSKQRVSMHLQQANLSVKTRILDLDYDKFIRPGTGVPTLVDRAQLTKLLGPAKAAK